VAVTLHEVAHAVVGVLQGRSPELFASSVDQGPGTESQQLATALAGPTFSLLSGLAVLRFRPPGLAPFWRLCWLWLGLASVQSFNGYLITGPLVTAGDIGNAWKLLDAPTAVPWLGFLVGWGLTFLLGRSAAGWFGELLDDPVRVRTDLPAVAIYGWLIGTALGVLLSLGVPGAGGVGLDVALLSALGVMASGVCVAFVGLFVPRAVAGMGEAPVTFGVPVAGLAGSTPSPSLRCAASGAAARRPRPLRPAHDARRVGAPAATGSVRLVCTSEPTRSPPDPAPPAPVAAARSERPRVIEASPTMV